MPLTVFHPSNEDDLDANADLRLEYVTDPDHLWIELTLEKYSSGSWSQWR